MDADLTKYMNNNDGYKSKNDKQRNEMIGLENKLK